MGDAIRKAGVGRLTAEVEIGLARVTHRPLADAIIEIEQTGLVGDLGARLGRNQAARRRGRDRRLLVAGTLADEAAGADRTILQFLRRQLPLTKARLLRGSRGRFALGRGLGLGSGGLGGSASRSGGGLLQLLLLARLDRRGALLEPKAVRLADHRVAADAAEFVGDLAGGGAFVPHLLQALDALFG